MKTIVITNLKGGVGKTTSAVNLGYSMVTLGKRVLLVDADPQSNLTPFFVKSHGYSGRTIQEVFRSPEKIRNIIARTKYENIDIIKGSVKLKEADASDEKALGAALSQVRQEYDICVIDTRPAVEAVTRSALLAGDVFLTPVQLENFCRDNLSLLEDELTGIAYEKDATWRIFANMVINKRSQLAIYTDMVQKHDWPFMENCISRSEVVNNALQRYKPVMKHRRSSRVAKDYLELAKELLEV